VAISKASFYSNYCSSKRWVLFGEGGRGEAVKRGGAY